MLKDLQGTVAQVLSGAMWLSDLSGHPAIGAILHDPNTAQDVNMLIAGAFGVYGVIHTIVLALQKKEAIAVATSGPGFNKYTK